MCGNSREYTVCYNAGYIIKDTHILVAPARLFKEDNVRYGIEYRTMKITPKCTREKKNKI